MKPSKADQRMASAKLVAFLIPLAAWAAQAAQAQTSGGSGLTVVPRISLTQTWTDNLQQNSTGGGGISKDAALITNVTPGVSVVSRSGRVRGTLDYALNGIFYLKSEQKNQVQHLLSANAVAEVVEKTFLVDTRASISQQAVSAFGRQTIDSSLGNANRNQVTTLYVSPSLRGNLGSVATVDLRGNLTETNVKDSIVNDSRTSGGSLNINSMGNSRLGWSLTGVRQLTRFKAGLAYHNSSANAGLIFRPDIELRLGVSAGLERNDLQSRVDNSASTYGVNAQWTPSPRTTLVADWQKHNYGNAHNLTFDYRMARSAWRIADSQSVNLGSANGAAGVRSNYDLLYLQYASQEPDPGKRDALVRSTLQSLGLSVDAVSTTGFISASPTLQRRRELSFSMQALRTTLVAMVSQSNSRRLGAAPTTADDFSQSTRIVQRSASLSAGHRLTPESTLTLSLSEQRSTGDIGNQFTTLRSVLANWGGRLGPKTAVSLGARHSTFAGAAPYSENALFANLIQTF